MSGFFVVLMSLQILVSILLVLVILMQSSKGGGLAGTFGGGQMGMMFGVRRTADFLIRATQILGAAFIIISLAINLLFLRPSTAGTESVIQRSGADRGLTPQLPPQTAPEQGAPAGQEQAPPSTPQQNPK
jgi:preprotein translocase subunit SecG